MKHTDFLYPAGRGFSRRNLLHGASVGIGASMLSWLFPARSRAEQGPQHYPTLGISKPSLASMPIAWWLWMPPRESCAGIFKPSTTIFSITIWHRRRR